MAYVDSTPAPGARARAMLGVGAIHAVMAVGVYTGLTITGVIAPPAAILDTFDVPPVAPPPEAPPETPPEAVPETSSYVPPVAPKQEILLPADSTVVVPQFDEALIRPDIPGVIPGSGIVGSDLIIPAPPAPPSFAAAGPVPRNGPAGWITSDDYPRRELMRESEGTARYRLVIGSNGRVETCEIVQSSGFAGLDAETCSLLQRRARFEPATDTSGARVVGTFTGAVTWQIP